MRKITVFFNSALPHFTQMFAGLDYLREHRKIELVYRLDKFRYPPCIFQVNLDDKMLIFDMADSAEVHQPSYLFADFYIKRMLLKKDFGEREKLLPYGLNYQVFYKNKFLKPLFLKDRKLLKYSLRYSMAAASILNIKDCIGNNELSKMETVPAPSRKTIFRSRLWNPENTDVDWKKQERKLMNLERIQMNRLVGGKYTSSFLGGIQEDSFSKGVATDMLLPHKEYHKRNYLRKLKPCSIRIVHRGLEGSVSWKFGENIAYSLAVVTSPVELFELLEPLHEEEHYLTYDSPEQSLERVDRIYSNERLRKRMQLANRQYYQNWLHPGKKMLKIFEMVENR